MKIARAAAAVTLTAGLLLGLGACSADSADPGATSADETAEPQDDETYDLFTAVSLLALDASLGEESQETADALRDAVFASSGPCTDEGVTLTV